MARWHNYPDDYLMTQEECAGICGCAPSTIAAHRMAGLLPYKITRPVTIRAGDFRVYFHMLHNGHKSQLHRSLRIAPEDCPSYSRLDGMATYTERPEEVVIDTVIKATDMLWKKYKAKAQQRGDNKHAENTRRRARLRVVKAA